MKRTSARGRGRGFAEIVDDVCLVMPWRRQYDKPKVELVLHEARITPREASQQPRIPRKISLTILLSLRLSK